MKTLWLVTLFFAVGCASFTESNPLLVAPAPHDWEMAFSRLSATEQALLKGMPMSFGVSTFPVDHSIYHMMGTSLTDEISRFEQLDIVAICEGFNRVFGNGSGKRWTVVKALSYEQIGTPSGVQKHRFELRWTFSDSTGKTLAVSAMDFGPGVKVVWGASREAIAAETNQAFALTFLKLVAELNAKNKI